MNIYQAIAVISAALAVVAGSWDAYRLRREQRYSAVVLAITGCGPILSLWLYLTVTSLELKPIVSIALLAAGAAAGAYAANRAQLSEVESSEQIRIVGASWLPLPAALSVGAIQICGAIDSLAGMILALAALEASVAFGVAAAATLWYKRSSMVSAGSAGATPPGPDEPNPPQPQAAAG